MKFEGRSASRIDTKNFVSYRLLDDTGKVLNEGMILSRDLSRTGISLQAGFKFEIGAMVQLTIGIGNELLKVQGTVRNCSPVSGDKFQAGVEFDFLSDEDLNKIALIYPDAI